MTNNNKQDVALHDVLRSLDAASHEVRIQLLPAFQKATSFVPVFLRGYSTDTTDALIEDVLAHLENVFVLKRKKTFRYRGDYGERSAKRFVKQTARNKLLSLLRRKSLQEEHAGAATACSDAEFDLAHAAGRRVLREVRESIREKPSGESNLALVLETAFFGFTTREQAERSGFPPDLPHSDWVRVRNLIDNRRRLGRRTLSKALHQLVRERRVHRRDARVFAEFCGCSWDCDASSKGGLQCA